VTGRQKAALAFGSGVVFAASQPPIDLTAGILVGLGGFALAISDHERSGRRGFLFGFGANLVALRFVPEVITRFTPLPYAAGVLALILLSMAQALPWMAGGAISALVARRVPRLPSWLTFAIGVYAALFVPAVFPWTPAGGLAMWPVLLQTSEVVGERGASFFVAIGCALFATAIGKRTWRPALAGAGIFALLAAYGATRMRSIEAARSAAPHAKIALVSPDFSAGDRWDESRATMMMDRLTALTKSAESRGAALTIWPESSYPYTLSHGTRRMPAGHRALLQEGVRGPVLAGVYMKGGSGRGYNSALLATPDGELSRSYDKRHLLWFGETVPLADKIGFLRRAFSKGLGLEPGTESVLFEAGNVRAAVLNCYEDTLPDASREAIEIRPNLLVNITNDAWFAGSSEGDLHLRLAVLRSIETRRDMVRAVNRGPTTWVSATGTILARRDVAAGVGAPPPLLVDAALLDAPITPYAVLADTPLLLFLVGLIAVERVLFLRALRARTSRRSRVG
jgi:apolipoprotein N-acyltransferase